MTAEQIERDRARTRAVLRAWCKLDQTTALPLRAQDWALGDDGFRRNPLADVACCSLCLVKMIPSENPDHGWICKRPIHG